MVRRATGGVLDGHASVALVDHRLAADKEVFGDFESAGVHVRVHLWCAAFCPLCLLENELPTCRAEVLWSGARLKTVFRHHLEDDLRWQCRPTGIHRELPHRSRHFLGHLQVSRCG